MPACHAGDRGFDSRQFRQFFALVAQLVEQGTENPRVGGSTPPRGTTCGYNSVVECHLAKVKVEGSNPFARSKQTPSYRI